MEPRLVKLDDVMIKLNGQFIGAVTKLRYEVGYDYNTITGPDHANPIYDIEVSFRPIIGTKRHVAHRLNGATVEIIDPWRTVKFGGCETRTYSNYTDANGMVETIRLSAVSIEIA